MSRAPGSQGNVRPTRVSLTPEGFARLLDVSRETLDRFRAYHDLLAAWNRRINLVGRETMGDPWRRHFLDSAQLLPLLPQKARSLVDLGSGAGFPGLVLALLGVPETHLIEADQRKAAFLREAARVTGARVTVHARRIEQMPPFAANVVTARALAPLPDLLALAAPFLGTGTTCLFLKGKGAAEELTAAAEAWKMRAERFPSVSDPAGTILRLETVTRGP